MIGSRGRVLPTTNQNVRLRAELESGETINGETRIVRHASPIRRLSLEPSPRPHPDVLAALVNADGIVVGPGSLYTSVLPNLLVEGVAATMYGVNAVRIYVANLMTEPGETDHYSLDDHLRVIRAPRGSICSTTSSSTAGRSTIRLRSSTPLADRACRRRTAAGARGQGAGRRVRACGRVGWEEDQAPPAVAGTGDSSAGEGWPSGADSRVARSFEKGLTQFRRPRLKSSAAGPFQFMLLHP